MRKIAAYLLIAVAWARPAGAQCGGSERWAVKVGSDAGAPLVDIGNPVTKTLHELVNIPRPQISSDDVTRVAQERTVYIVDARLVKFRVETGKTGDLDFHIVLSDDTLQFSSKTTISPHSFVAEIVNPDCISGSHGTVPTPSRFQTQLTNVRAKFLSHFQNPDLTGGWNPGNGVPVRLTGVAFFDRDHGQIGRAATVIELHPLLDVEFNPGTGPTPTPTPSALLQNPGFEAGVQGWTATTNVISNDQNQPAHSGTFKAWLGGYGVVHTDRLSQRVNLPSVTTGMTLSFYLRISTEEQTTTQAYDKLRVQVRDANGHVTTLQTLSNLQAAQGFSLKTYDLTPFRGQTVTIQLEATEDGGSETSFVVDDFSIVVEQ
jgi:hypothetical protein